LRRPTARRPARPVSRADTTRALDALPGAQLLPYTILLVRAGLYATLTAAAAYAALCGALYLGQGRIVYLAWYIRFKAPVLHKAGAQTLHVNCGDATIGLWSLHRDRRTALLYFGGSAENVSINLADFHVWFPDHAIYLVNYRGYPGSTGRPSEARMIADGRTVFDWVAARHEQVVVIGKSLGTGIAAAVAACRCVEKLILVTPYDSLANVAADYLPYLPVRWLLQDGYDCVRPITQVRTPVLVVVAGRDGLVLKPRSDALIAAIPAAYRHVSVIEDARHTDIRRFSEYGRSLREFLADTASQTTRQPSAA